MSKETIEENALSTLIEFAHNGHTEMAAFLFTVLSGYLKSGKPIPKPLRDYFAPIFTEVGTFGTKRSWNAEGLKKKLKLTRPKGVPRHSRITEDRYIVHLVTELRSKSPKPSLEKAFAKVASSLLHIEGEEDKVKKAYYRGLEELQNNKEPDTTSPDQFLTKL